MIEWHKRSDGFWWKWDGRLSKWFGPYHKRPAGAL